MIRPLLHFSHANSYPAGTYRQLFDFLRQDFDVRALDMHGHDPAYPAGDGWQRLVDELIVQLERHEEPAVLVGHSLGGLLCMMAAKQRPDLARCVVMLDSPVLAGWRAVAWRLAKLRGIGSRFSPAKFSERRRTLWPSFDAALQHFSAKPIFAAWAPGVLADYLESGLRPHPEGVELRFSREVETVIYNTLPHHMGAMLRDPFPVPIGFIGGTRSAEMRQAGVKATRKLVGENFVMVEGGHLFPMESPRLTAEKTRDMAARLLAQR
jgi:pimeloyl-ACP methyl ester carboxylesterase